MIYKKPKANKQKNDKRRNKKSVKRHNKQKFQLKLIVDKALKKLRHIVKKIWYGLKWFAKLVSRPVGFLGDLASIISLIILVFFFIKGIETYDGLREKNKYEDNSNKAVEYWIEDISKIKIGCNSEYLKSILGEPIYVESISFYDALYKKAYYFNSYCTIMCIYDSDSTLIGYMVIGNNISLKAKNYRGGFTLFDYSINDAERYCEDNHIGPVMYCTNNMSGRFTCNQFYFQCSFQHSYGATPEYYIGYGVCSIGAVDSYDNFEYAIRNMKSYFKYNDYKTFYEESKGDIIRDIPINVSFVMRCIDHMDEFLEKYLAGDYLCLSVDDFANYQSDYTGYINDLIERTAKYNEQHAGDSTEE